MATSGGTWVDTPERGFIQADTTITGPGLRVVQTGSTAFSVTLAGITDDDLGASKSVSSGNGWGNTGDRVSVSLATKQGTMRMTANGAITLFANVYPAASGKISGTASGAAIGVALEAAATDGDWIEVMRYPKNPGDMHRMADPGNAGAIAVTKSAFVPLVSAGAETRTLAIPTFEGQMMALSMQTDGGDIVVTAASAINQTGNNTITFNDVGDVLVLIAVNKSGALCWRTLTSDGTSLSTV